MCVMLLLSPLLFFLFSCRHTHKETLIIRSTVLAVVFLEPVIIIQQIILRSKGAPRTREGTRGGTLRTRGIPLLLPSPAGSPSSREFFFARADVPLQPGTAPKALPEGPAFGRVLRFLRGIFAGVPSAEPLTVHPLHVLYLGSLLRRRVKRKPNHRRSQLTASGSADRQPERSRGDGEEGQRRDATFEEPSLHVAEMNLDTPPRGFRLRNGRRRMGGRREEEEGRGSLGLPNQDSGTRAQPHATTIQLHRVSCGAIQGTFQFLFQRN